MNPYYCLVPLLSLLASSLILLLAAVHARWSPPPQQIRKNSGPAGDRGPSGSEFLDDAKKKMRAIMKDAPRDQDGLAHWHDLHDPNTLN